MISGRRRFIQNAAGLLIPAAALGVPAIARPQIFHGPVAHSAGANLLTSLISFWELEESSGTRVDAHGSNDLTDNNTVTSNTGKVGTCAQFTEANDEFLSHADTASLQTGDINFTYCAWIYIDSIANTFPRVIDKASVTGGALLYVRQENSRVTFAALDSGGGVAVEVLSTDALSTATWYFLCAWFQADGAGPWTEDNCYVSINDGTPDNAAQTAAPAAGNQTFRIGGNDVANRNWDGRMDQFGFWKRVLTQDEITWLYNSGNGRAYAELG